MYKIINTASFERDLDSIMDYLINTLQTKNAAVRLLERTEEIVSHISENPYMFPLYYDKEIAERGYHFAVIGNYLLFYTISEEKRTVIISRLLYGRRNIPDQL